VGNGGKFTPEAKAIYEIVLEMQRVLKLVFIVKAFLIYAFSCPWIS